MSEFPLATKLQLITTSYEPAIPLSVRIIPAPGTVRQLCRCPCAAGWPVWNFSLEAAVEGLVQTALEG
jgi:hypothetical protein